MRLPTPPCFLCRFWRLDQLLLRTTTIVIVLIRVTPTLFGCLWLSSRRGSTRTNLAGFTARPL